MSAVSYAVCPCKACQKVAHSHSAVQAEFGLRQSSNGRTLAQSYCRRCRSARCTAGQSKCR